MRARVGADEGLFPVDWQFCNPGAKALPFEHCFGSSRFDPERFDLMTVGEVRQVFYPPAETRLPGWLKGDHFCGTPQQWLEGYPVGTPLPALIDGTPACCAADLDGAYDCGYEFGYLTGGECP